MDGFLLIDKPKNITSFGVCNNLKRKFNLKCGHNGTLDPNTTGLMVVALGSATKLLKLINEHDKTYLATITFGILTDTLDICGNVLKDYDMQVNKEDLLKALEVLKNKDSQIPPLTSAIKVNGKKLLEYQRKGIEVKVDARNVKIYDYKIVSDLRYENNHYSFDIILDVSKGFYVRSFARDLGELLGGVATLLDLRRIKCGSYDIKDAIKLDEVKEEDIINITSFFDFPKVEVNDYIAKLVKNGITLDERQTKLNGVFYVTHNCDIIAIYEEVDLYKYKPILIF